MYSRDHGLLLLCDLGLNLKTTVGLGFELLVFRCWSGLRHWLVVQQLRKVEPQQRHECHVERRH